jgi:ADP-ribose pyrophosphatase YjhB (NUDIX family)
VADDTHLFQVRVTGVLIEEGEILIVRQRLSGARDWSLPGGRLQWGETLEQGLQRELEEETGLTVRVPRLLYLCDRLDAVPPLLHISFLVERVSGSLRPPSNEFDENPISAVRMVPIRELPAYGFSEKFRGVVEAGFPGAGSYVGGKEAIGLD